MLLREGYRINHKKVYRIYREEDLSLRRKKRKKIAAQRRTIPRHALKRNERWSMDFLHDSLDHGRRIRILAIIDQYTRECPAIEVDYSLTGRKVVGVLENLKKSYGLPKSITVDNGTEFYSREMDSWSFRRKVELAFIRPGRPVENAFCESFNGRLRDECLNTNIFYTLKEAKFIIEEWRKDCNCNRPHGSLQNLTPQEFANTEGPKFTAVLV